MLEGRLHVQISMLRMSSILMMILLISPVVRDCCLPVTHFLPCHESKHGDDAACFSNQEAITGTRSSFTERPMDGGLCALPLQLSRSLGNVAYAPREALRIHTAHTDLFLWTGALLI